MNMIASKAVALKEALSDDFKQYQKRVLDNAQALSKGLMKRNINIVSGGTDNHLMLVEPSEHGAYRKSCGENAG